MGFGSPVHWILLMLVVVLLFGGGRVSNLMGDVAKGIKSFKKGMAEDDHDDVRPTPRLNAQPPVAQSPVIQPPVAPNPDHDLQPMKDDRPAA